MRTIRIVLLLAMPLAAQPPAISRTGVFNSASRIPAVFPCGGIARGARFTIAGVRLGSPGQPPEAWIGAKTPVAVLRASANELEARMPEHAPLGEARLVVKTAQGTSAPASIRVVQSAFGIYSANGDGWGPALAERVALGVRKRVTLDEPARRGDTVHLAGTGLGPDAARVWVGREPARVVRTQRRPDSDDLAIEIPANAPESCATPVQVAQGSAVSNTVTIAIGSAGPCAIAPYAPKADRHAARSAALLLARTVRGHPESPGEQVTDEALAAFFEAEGGGAARWPPLGTCTTWVSRDKPESDMEWLASWIGNTGLDAGPRINVAAAQSKRSVAVGPRAAGLYYRQLGGEGGIAPVAPLLLEGELLLTGNGGRDVGPFRAAIPAPQPFSWSQPGDTVERQRGLIIRWSGGIAGGAMVIGVHSTIAGAVAACFCVAPADSKSFAIPPRYLANLPATGDPDARAGIVLASIPGRDAKLIVAAGLANGWAAGVFARVMAVRVR